MKSKCIIFIVVILLLVIKFQALIAQKEGQELIDSLFAELPKLSDDTNKVKTLATLSIELADFDLEKGVEVGNQALDLAEKLSYDYGIALAKLSLSRNYWYHSEQSLVMEHILDAERIFEETKDIERLCATYCLLCGVSYRYDSNKGLEYYQKAKSLLIKHKDNKWKIKNLWWIMSFSEIAEPDSTNLYNMQLREILRLSKGDFSRQNLFNILAYYYKSKNDIDSALFFYKKVDTIVQKLNNKKVLTRNYASMGNLYLEKGKDPNSGMTFLELAEECFKRSLILAEEYGSLYHTYMGHLRLYQLQKEQGKFSEALKSHENFLKTYLKWYNRNNAGEIAYISLTNEMELKDKDFEILQIQNKRRLTIINGVIIGVGILILLTILLIIIWRKNLQIKRTEIEHQLLTMEQQALQSMMNPHFIFNSMGSIQNYILQKNTSKAGLYLSQFARLIRQNLNAIKAAMINLDEEADRLNNYLDLEKMRLTNKFEYSITIDESIEASETFIPSMMIQPLVENALWHGITRLKEKGMVSVYFHKEDEHAIKIIVEDNGIGLKKSDLYSTNSQDHLGLTLDLNRKRLELLGKKFNVITRIEFSEAFPDRENPGTHVEIIVPYSYTDSLV